MCLSVGTGVCMCLHAFTALLRVPAALLRVPAALLQVFTAFLQVKHMLLQVFASFLQVICSEHIKEWLCFWECAVCFGVLSAL